MLIFVLLISSFIRYCEQRELYYSAIDNKEIKSNTAFFYRNASTVTSCGAKCFDDDCCVRFIYDKISKQCIGVHIEEKHIFSYEQIPLLSYEAHQFRKDCGSGWIESRGHCYFYEEQKVTWSEAKMTCQKMCSYLVEIEDLEESDWLATTFLQKVNCPTSVYSGCNAWTGGNDLNIEGQFVWDHSNTSLVFTNWNTGEPSLNYPPQASTRDCIDIFRNGKWNDRPCLHFNSYICERSIDL